MIEYDCCECKIHVVLITGDKAPEPPLCATCMMIPGWHEDPELRAILDPFEGSLGG